MAAKRRNVRRKPRREAPGKRRTPARRPTAAGAIAGLAAEIHGLAERLATCERRHDEVRAAVAAATEALQAREDDTQAAIHDLQAAVEPLRMAATGTASPEDIARQVEYLDLVARVRRAVRDRVPRSARVLVVGRGDEELVRLFGRAAAHFPQDAAGDFAGEYPADGPAAVAALERLAAAGWDHLVIPATSAWWLDHYREFRVHLHREWLAVHRDPDSCTIFARDPARPGAWHEFDAFIADFRRTQSRSPAMLDWETGSDLAGFLPRSAVFPPVDRGAEVLPYMDRSIDVVAIPWGDATRRGEARRIASAAVVEIATPGIAGPGFRIAIELVGCQVTTPAAARAPRRLGLITPAVRPASTARPAPTAEP